MFLKNFDSAPSNKRYENYQVHCEPEKHRWIAWYCETHKWMNVASSQYFLVKPQISSMIAFGLAERHSGAIELLKECCHCFLSCRLHVYAGAEPPHCNATVSRLREKIKELCLVAFSQKPQMRERIECISFFLNGDWEVAHRVEHYCPLSHGGSAGCRAASLFH